MRRLVWIALVAAGCTRPSTEIVIGVATDLSARDQVDKVVLSALQDNLVEVIHQEWDISGQVSQPFELPGSFGVFTDDGSEPRINVKVYGYHGNTQLVQRYAILSLVKEKTLFARMAIVDACSNMACPSGSTCIEGACRPQEVNSATLPEYQLGMETSVLCNSGTIWRNTSTKAPLPVAGTGACPASDVCIEGTCYHKDPTNAFDAGMIQMGDASVEQDMAMGGPTDLAYDIAPPNLNCMTAMVDTLSGTGAPGYSDGTGGAKGTAAFHGPSGIAVDKAGNVYVADTQNHRVRVILPYGDTGTLAGNGLTALTDGTGGANGTASFVNPIGLAVDDAAGALYVSDAHAIRKVSLTDGTTSTVCGNAMPGLVDGPKAMVQFSDPAGLALDGKGNLFVADSSNNVIRQVVVASGTTSTFAGGNGAGWADGQGALAAFFGPQGLAIDKNGNLYVADLDNCRVRAIDTMANVTTIAGDGNCAFLDGLGVAAELAYPSGVAVDPMGNIYVADSGNDRIRKIDNMMNVTTEAGSGVQGYLDSMALLSRFYEPAAITYGGGLLIADQLNNRIRRIQCP
jgi:sugar lactone lactonase YvrE